MKMGIFDAWKFRVISWLEEPLSQVPILTEPEKKLKEPARVASDPRENTRSGRDKGKKNREVIPNIPEFHARGSAGHREIYNPKAAHKGVLPDAGKGVKHPK